MLEYLLKAGLKPGAKTENLKYLFKGLSTGHRRSVGDFYAKIFGRYRRSVVGRPQIFEYVSG